jgi:hypothetical protein
MKYLISMRTINRNPKKNYVGQTLGSLKASGLWESDIPFQLHIFDSGSEDTSHLSPPPRGTTIHIPRERQSANQTAVDCLLAAEKIQCDWVICLEDDIAVCDGWLERVDKWLEQEARPGRRVYTFYAPYPHEIRDAINNGETCWEYPIKNFYGTQCLAFRRADALSAGEFLRDVWISGQAQGKPMATAFDISLHHWSREKYPEIQYFLASAPSFVEHIGEESVLTHGIYHRSGAFDGKGGKAS